VVSQKSIIALIELVIGISNFSGPLELLELKAKAKTMKSIPTREQAIAILKVAKEGRKGSMWERTDEYMYQLAWVAAIVAVGRYRF
jgi:hypothetical protein